MLIAGVALLGMPSAVRADPKSYAACIAKAGNTVASIACQKGELAEAEAELNAAYARAMAALAPDQKEKLKAAERQWIGFRQSDCDVFYGRETGTIASIEAGACMIERSRSRIRDLRGFFTP